jgi:hypothetical protein
MNYPIVQHIDDVEAPVVGRDAESAADTTVSCFPDWTARAKKMPSGCWQDDI